MNKLLPSTLLCTALTGALLAAAALPANASGVTPETSVVLLNAADGEASMIVKNTESTPVLLINTVENIAEDQEDLVLVTPPVIRVEAGGSQQVRFVLKGGAPLTTERLKRVTFEGVPQTKSSEGSQVQISVRQNLPLIIHPAGLAADQEPWKRLTWSISGSGLTVHNPSAYVVRLSEQVHGLTTAGGEPVALGALPKAYVLPGESLQVRANEGANFASSKRLKIFPATVYGYAVDSYETDLVQPSTTAAR